MKAILRTLARRRIGPRIAAGRKRGFSIPVERWLASRWLPAVNATLSGSRLAAEGWIRTEGVREELAALQQRGSAGQQLWYLFVLESWLRAERLAPIPAQHVA